jgi:hypothetical protein
VSSLNINTYTYVHVFETSSSWELSEKGRGRRKILALELSETVFHVRVVAS